MSNPEELNRALSERADQVISTYFPNAKKTGASWKLGDIDGNSGSSAGIFRGHGGIYLFKDNNTGDSTNILGLLHHALGGTWSDTMATAKKMCGIHDVTPTQKPKKPSPPAEKRHSMRGTPAFKYLHEERGLGEKTLMTYEIRSHNRPSKYNEDFWSCKFIDTDGDYVMIKSTGINKISGSRKDIWSSAPYATLWGWWLVDDNTREIIITEGEIDAMSLHQMGADCPVLSMPSGSSNLGWIASDYIRLQQFERIYIFTDMDDSGERAAQEIAKRLGLTRCFRSSLPEGYNDANEFLISKEYGKTTLMDICRDSKTYDPQTMIGVEATTKAAILRNDEMIEAVANRNFVFPSLDFKLIPKDTGILTGMIGHGKTDWGNFLMLNEIRTGEIVCIGAFDTPMEDLLRLCAWQIFGHEPSSREIVKASEMLAGKLYFIDGVNNTINSTSLLQDMEYACHRFGCTRFMIDNLSEVDDINKDDYDGQDRFVRSIDKFDKKNGTNTMIVAHALMSSDSETHIPARRDVEGSKGMVKPIQYGMTMFRNKVKEKPDEYDEGDRTIKRVKRLLEGEDVYLSIWKQRNGFREEFIQGLKYCKKARWYSMPYEKFKSPFPSEGKQVELIEVPRELMPSADYASTDTILF